MKQLNPTCRFISPAAIGILSCSIILVSACDIDRGSSVSGPQAVERGEQLFNYNCGYCHGAEGRGPKLAELTSLSENDRRGKIINHPIAGQIPQRLRAHELSDLNEFLDSK